MRKFLVIALIAAAAVTAHGMFLEEGTSEFSVSGMLDFDTANGTLTDVNLFYGYFFMDYLEIGLAGSYLNDDAVQVWAVGPKAEYNFDIGYSVVPYVGGTLKVAATDLKNSSDNNTAGIAGLEAGAKFFITEYAAVSAALVGEAATDDIYPVKNGKTDSTDLRAELGMRIFF
jgi:hypothetical protein